ncbi:hypothetical protein ACFSE1_18210 [Rhizobium helianthi]|uniref:Uncharacterized protein n=1 Tax=Rhizobium helianthi TaxID=1132695 RepID=A0ABW4M9B2_9HYPH
MSWTIHPYISVNDIKFGSKSEELSSIIGIDPKIKNTKNGEKRYEFGIDCPHFTYSSNDQLEEVSFSQYVSRQIFLLERRLSWDDGLSNLQYAYELSKRSNTFEVVGFIVFLELGVAFSGFHDGDADQKAIVCFTKHRWDRFIPEMRPVHF